MAPSTLKGLLTGGGIGDALIGYEFDKLFHKWRGLNDAPRTGLHASAIIVPKDQFCYRELVLAPVYQHNEVPLSAKTLRIFLHGTYVHMKWQFLFEMAGLAEHVERKNASDLWNVQLTPDAVIKLLGKRWIVEIKTMYSRGYNGLHSPPANAVRQAQFYMAQTGIPQGIILVENKDNQEYKTWMIEFDPKVARKFLVRLHNLKARRKKHATKGLLPKRICASPKDVRAKACALREACFGDKYDRRSMKLVQP